MTARDVLQQRVGSNSGELGLHHCPGPAWADGAAATPIETPADQPAIRAATSSFTVVGWALRAPQAN